MGLGPSTREQDFSTYVAGASKTSLGVVGAATKGEVGVPTLCTSQTDFISKFGLEDTNCTAVYAALHYLAVGNRLWFTRIANSSSVVTADVDVPGTQLPTTTIADLLTFQGKTPGTYFNDYDIVIANVSGAEFDLSVKKRSNGVVVEKFTGLDLSKTGLESVSKVLELNSQYIKVSATKVVEGTNYTLTAGTYSLASGNNGITGLTSTEFLAGVNLMTSDNIDMSLLSTPGSSDAAVIAKALEICENRGDCVYLVDPPSGLAYDHVADWHNGQGDYTAHAAFNSSFGFLTWAWQQIYDETNKVTVSVPPSVVVAPVIARSDLLSEVWFAPAGLVRGLLKNVLRSVTVPDSAQRDFLYEDGNNVNCIITHPTAGLALYGNKTLQRTASATDRLNVRRLMIYLRKLINTSCAYLTFEPNDRVTWNEFEDMIEPVLRGIKDKRGIYDYKIVMNDSSVLPGDIDSYRMPGKILIQPTKAAEYIPIDFVLTRTGADFAEVLGTN